MSKAFAKIVIEQQKKTAKTNKYLGSATILQEQLDLLNIESLKLNNEIKVFNQTYTSVASIKHERKLKDVNKEGAVKRWKEIVESRQRNSDKAVEDIESDIQYQEEALREAQKKARIKIDKLKEKIIKEREEAKEIIERHEKLINQCYEQAAIDIPIEVKYPPTYYKKEQQKKDMDNRTATLAKLIAIIDALGEDADEPIVVAQTTSFKPLVPWSQLNIKEDPVEKDRARRREQARQEDLELQRKHEQKEKDMYIELYAKKEAERAVWRKADQEDVIYESSDSEGELTDEKVAKIRKDNLKQDIKDIDFLIADKSEELSYDSTNRALEAELKGYLEASKNMKRELKMM